MEYGYYITDTAGNRTWFTEGCTYCSMSTGGQHEQHCPFNPNYKTPIDRERFINITIEVWPTYPVWNP